MVFKFFCILIVYKILLSSCLLLWKYLLIMDILLEAASESPSPQPPTRLAATQRELWVSISHLKKPTVNHPPSMKSNTVTCFKINWTIYRITGGFVYAATSNLKRVTGRIFSIRMCFHRSQTKLYLLFSPKTRKQKALKTIGKYTESTDLIFN